MERSPKGEETIAEQKKESHALRLRSLAHRAPKGRDDSPPRPGLHLA